MHVQGQCVGAHNLRHFLLFLVFTIVGCCYILLLAAVLLQQRSAPFLCSCILSKPAVKACI